MENVIIIRGLLVFVGHLNGGTIVPPVMVVWLTITFSRMPAVAYR